MCEKPGQTNSVNVLGASSHPNLKPPFQPGVAAAPRSGMESSVKTNLPWATRFISVFICNPYEKAQNH